VRYAGDMRYPDSGGLTAAERAQHERVRLAAELIEAGSVTGGGGVYPSFPDSDPQDWARAYNGASYGRLLRVKAHHDPDNFFAFTNHFQASPREVGVTAPRP
jgi:hypothetical protein